MIFLRLAAIEPAWEYLLGYQQFGRTFVLSPSRAVEFSHMG
jgi:hypothetical protein